MFRTLFLYSFLFFLGEVFADVSQIPCFSSVTFVDFDGQF